MLLIHFSHGLEPLRNPTKTLLKTHGFESEIYIDIQEFKERVQKSSDYQKMVIVYPGQSERSGESFEFLKNLPKEVQLLIFETRSLTTLRLDGIELIEEQFSPGRLLSRLTGVRNT